MADIQPIAVPPRVKNQIGRRFYRLTVVAYSHKRNAHHHWLCACDCGNLTTISVTHIGRKGPKAQKSCGCLLRESTIRRSTTHGGRKTLEWDAWARIIDRCTNANAPGWKNYGGRGITVCKEWRHDFAAFLAHVGPRPSPQHSIDRIDNSQGYTPGNVRWATRTEQNRNRRNNHRLEFRGEARCLAEWGDVTGIPAKVINDRINRDGWSVERALTTPAKKCKRQARPA
jgi:hypothetical protein